MATLVTLILFAQTPPGPLDAFRANFASIRADVDYRFEFGTADSSTTEPGKLWKGEAIGFVETATRAVEGRWSYDGAVERYEGRAPDAALQKARMARGNGETRPFVVEPFESVFDGEAAAYHRIKGESVDRASHILSFTKTREPPWIGSSGAPFCWWGKSRFPVDIEGEFKDAHTERVQSVVNGFRTEVEIYRQNTSDVRSLEVHYDPSIGYIPRYARVTGPINATTQAVKELYMLDARPCGAGGFVPFEWYTTSYSVNDFPRRYPDYSYKTVVRPTYHLIAVEHRKSLRMTNRKRPVVLEKLAGITAIATREGTTNLQGASGRMSLEEVEVRLRRVFAHPKPPPPAIAVEEMNKFSNASGSNWGWYAALGACVAVALFAAGLISLRRRCLFLVLTGLVAASSGCGGSTPRTAPQLEGELSPSLIVYEPTSTLLDMTLSLTNRSTRAVKLFQASGGCSCRKIDQRSFPADLKPGQGISLAITVSDDLSYKPRRFVVALSTDRGILELPVQYVAFPRHRLSPQSINLGTLTDGQGEEASFELVHREVFERGRPRATISLQVPPQFSVANTGSRETELLEDRRLAFADKSYRLTLKDKNHGLNKVIVRLGGPVNGTLVEAAIVWQRVPYLSSNPAKLYIGTRPLRAFLRCPDETVELTRIVSAPPGIKAVVSSPREVTILPAKGAPETIDGAVEVETTATDRSPLRIPVVRYAPLASRNDSDR